jgi:hypothetical protein
VTPYPDRKHFPLPRPDSDILFLVDDNAQPVSNERLIAPLPLQFFAISDEKDIVAYVNEQNDIEQNRCARIYTGTDSARSCEHEEGAAFLEDNSLIHHLR